MASKVIDTKRYGEVTVRNALLGDNKVGKTLYEGIEITGDGFDLVEIPKYYDVEELSEEDIILFVDGI